MKVAIVIGATGLVGRHTVSELLKSADYSKVQVFTRRSLEMKHDKLEEHLCSFDALDEVKDKINGDVLFSCMGTTLKRAGSKDAQFKIDYTYQFEFADLASNAGVSELVLVSSTSASEESMFFYSRMKGKLENAVKQMRFDRIALIRPSVLVGDRPESRLGEKVGAKVMDVLAALIPAMRKYKGILGVDVAKSMLRVVAIGSKQKVSVYELDALFTLAREYERNNGSV